MKTIVALIDFSDVTFKVLKEVHSVAKAFGSHVVLLHVASKQPVVVDVGLMAPTVAQDPSPEMMREEEGRLLELRESLAKFGVESTVKQIQAEQVDEVLNEARALGATLVMVGSHSHGVLYRLFHRTVTDVVVRHAPCPVVVVPAASEVRRTQKILALVDFSDVTHRVLQHAEAFANAFQAEVTVAHAVPPEPVAVDYAPPPTEGRMEEFKAQVQALGDGLAVRGVPVKTVCAEGEVMGLVENWSREGGYDLVVMGSHGHGALYHLLVGSVTAGMVKAAACPVLIVPSQSDQGS